MGCDAEPYPNIFQLNALNWQFNPHARFIITRIRIKLRNGYSPGGRVNKTYLPGYLGPGLQSFLKV